MSTTKTLDLKYLIDRTEERIQELREEHKLREDKRVMDSIAQNFIILNYLKSLEQKQLH